MMTKTIAIFILALLPNFIFAKHPKVDVATEFKNASIQYQGMLRTHPRLTEFPQSTKPDGSPDNRSSGWWCSGFFAGSLWYLYEYTHQEQWKLAADKWTRALEKEKLNTATHDLGFMLFCSYGNGYRITGNKDYLEPLLTGAKSLATRYKPDYGVIKSWDHYGKSKYPVIIDNMMNLEFLMWASKASKNKLFRDISVSHSDHTIANHFRPDYSSYHLVAYEPHNRIAFKCTVQGANDSSAWARGQAWGLYGYTMMYRKTGLKRYLRQAEGIARFIINHPNLPADKIPYWDFDAPHIPNEERDASAAAIIASAMLELSHYSSIYKDACFNLAEQILVSLSSPAYKAKVGTNNFFILKHSVGHKPARSEVNTPIIYADYYYLEALMRYSKFFK